MKSMGALNIVLVTWFQFLVQLTAENNHAALVFNRYTSSLYDIPSSTATVELCDSWANACSAEDSLEFKFVKTKTLTQNALIVKQICEKTQTLDFAPVQKNICHYAYKISVLFNKNNWSFEFGYEIYYRMKYSEYFHTHYERKKYVKLEDVFKSVDEIRKLRKLAYKELKRSIFGEDKIVWYNEDYKMHFMWIRLFKISFDFSDWTPKKITYEIRNNNRWPVAWSCQSYNLGNEAYQGVNIDELYSENNQEILFSNLLLPEESSEAACGGGKGKKCLSKWLIIPIDQFHFGTLRESLCSNMATVPLWASTLELVMKKLDKFLYTLFRVLGTGLYIKSGISGTLQLPKIKTKIFGSKTAAVFLDSKNSRIPAPDIIYKIVKYKFHDCWDESDCWFSATVIVHNDPYFNPASEKKVCKEDVTSAWGWDAVTQFTTLGSIDPEQKSKYIYVCRTDSTVLNRLGQTVRWWNREIPKMADFNLNDFPVYNEEQHTYRWGSVDVHQTLLNLSEREEQFMPRMPLRSISEGDENDSGSMDVSTMIQLTEQIDPYPSNVVIERPRNGGEGDIADEAISDYNDDDDGEIRSDTARASSPVYSDGDDLTFSTPSANQPFGGKNTRRRNYISSASESEDEFFQGEVHQQAPHTMDSPSPERHNSPNR